MFRRPK